MNINTRFDAPHSHVYEVTRSQVEAVGVRVLAESEEAGLHLAVSADGLRFVFYQGHPEYDGNSLLKEFKREVERFVEGERSDYPAYPENFFGPGLLGVLGPFRLRTEQAVRERRPPPEFPEALLAPYVDNTWTDTGKAMFNNWLGLIYQLTHQDRRIPFMDGVDPDDPLALHRAAGG
jgi:homoserine O-succinyltransferase